jgi:uncharacterized protein (DUF1501 family)
MAITRRQFLSRTGLATAGVLLGPGLLDYRWLQRAAAATIGDRYFVTLFLDGGNDGLNTIVPVSGGSAGLRASYEQWRHAPSTAGGIRIVNPLVPAVAMTDPNTGTQLGFHPGLVGLRDMYEAHRVAVIQGCGYPEYNLSHDVSRSIWRHGAPLSTPATGWLGRYLAAAGYVGNDIPAVCIGGEVAGELNQSATSVLAFDRLRDFGFPYDDAYDPDDRAFKDAVFAALASAASLNGHPVMQYLGSTATATQLATTAYPPLHHDYVTDRPSWNALYSSDPNGLNTSTARNLREIAKVIYGVARGVPNVSARVFQLENGGYDTHSDQGTDHPNDSQYLLHREVGDAIKLFFDDLRDMSAGAPAGSGLENLASKVVVMIWTEFSRRIEQNDNGTDHGSQGPMFVIGDAVVGGVYGEHPNIAAAALDDDGNTQYKQDHSNGARSTDFRDVYGTLFKHWLGLTNAGTLAALLPNDTTLGYSGPDYWTAPNFDLGFVA